MKNLKSLDEKKKKKRKRKKRKKKSRLGLAGWGLGWGNADHYGATPSDSDSGGFSVGESKLREFISKTFESL